MMKLDYSMICKIESMAREGKSEKDIAHSLGILVNELRMIRSDYDNHRKILKGQFAKILRENGYSFDEIAFGMGMNESTIRAMTK